MIQVQGYCATPLASLTCQAHNAAVPVFVTAQSINPATGIAGTNYFQAFDVPVTNGQNTLWFTATNLAGNTSYQNFTYTLDYSSKTNPPAVQSIGRNRAIPSAATNSA